VDHRRRNKSEESLKTNVDRLKQYMARLIVFPRRSNRVKKGDSDKEAQRAATQLPTGKLLPIKNYTPVEAPRAITEAEKSRSQFEVLKKARADYRFEGIRAKRHKEKTEEEANKVGKK
jgi:large subunit ribosomal protein L13e